MDRVSIVLIVLLVIWGLLGVVVGSLTLRKQRVAGEAAHHRAYFANLGASRLQQVRFFVNENAPLWEREDIDPAVFVNVLSRTLGLLGEIEEEVVVASENSDDYSPTNVQNLLSAYYVLRNFAEHGAQVGSRRFGPSEDPSDQPDVSPHRFSRTAYDTMKRTDAAVSDARRRLVTS